MDRKRVLVTGGSRGLGLAICERLLVEGWQVIATSRTASIELNDLRARFEGRLEFVSADFTQPQAIGELTQAARILDGLDGLVANAAIGTEGLLTLLSEKDLRRCLEVNLISPMLLAREVIKGMLARGGSLVFISSIAAQVGFKGLTAYAAAKGGLVSFSRSLAREYGERGIRSNCVLPGYLETDMTAGLDSETRQKITRRTALKRLGKAEEVVGAVSFLLSDEARYVTGTEIVVDGGMRA
ncbi:MAG: SDR family oxidoreductase [Candidatus Omnitrophica bacterium]|nr:SDR family oxidoreductase [Candidatus Omnitrophota bacterium]